MYRNEHLEEIEAMPLSLNLPSPIESITFENNHFFLKHDERIHADFSGNKARKFHYFLHHKFSHIDTLVSYGSAQSNAMYSLSVLAKMRGWRFEYFVDHIADYLRENPHGNYKAALENGMRVTVGQSLPSDTNKHTLVVEEGGRQKEAAFGIEVLAEEIKRWQEEKGFGRLNVFLPSGTGTTALFLEQALLSFRSSSYTHVYTTPCVGDEEYLQKQFLLLACDTKKHPTILTLEKKYHFGKLYKENYKIWLKLQQQTGVEFDLLYDPLGWRTLLAHSEIFSTTIPTLYLHQGGLLGNESMLPRYQRKYKDLA